ncbi:DJ-1/PfpI family protein [Amycolatopsis sp. H6(2020)]|nr:DJ-1/PfpI family protein [Amycolatopsis sp. H6(2020)]
MDCPALGVLNRAGLRVSIAAPAPRVTSMNGVTIDATTDLDEAADADAVIIGSGIRTREVVEDGAIMQRLGRLDPARQLLAAQCSGTLVLAKLGLLTDIPACTDLTTKPWVIAAGVKVLNQPFFARGNIATAGGCLASTYLATWIITRLLGLTEAESAMHYVAPVGEKEEYVARALRNVTPYLDPVHS